MRLLRFIGVAAELFHTIYFHRTVRAIDLELKDLFAASRAWLFPGQSAGQARRVSAPDRLDVAGRCGPLA